MISAYESLLEKKEIKKKKLIFTQTAVPGYVFCFFQLYWVHLHTLCMVPPCTAVTLYLERDKQNTYLQNKDFHSNRFSAQKLFSTLPSLLIVHELLHYCHTVFHFYLDYLAICNIIVLKMSLTAAREGKCKEKCKVQR